MMHLSIPAIILLLLTASAATIMGEEESHWAFQLLREPTPPPDTQGDWSMNSIDHFVLADLVDAGLRPSPQADPATLLRRLSIDLTGLPPTLKELENFESAVTEKGPDQAYLALVERLLGSPHYGERWGRHWLDVSRYIQGKTKVAAVDRIDMAEPYRDYVVRALNSNKPFDQFVVEQIAGDILAEAESKRLHEDQLDLLAAPGFLSIGPWFADCADPNTLRMDIIDEQISTTTQAFLGLNFSCARCHDHFFDPVPTRDYYALAGIFGSTRILKENSSNWRDGRYRLTRPEASQKKIRAFEANEKLVDSLRRDRWKALAAAREDLLERELLQKDVDYRNALKSLPPMPAVEIEAEDYQGQNNVRRVKVAGETVVETQRERLQWVGWRPELPEAGTYTILLRCAAPESYRVELKIDGKSVLSEFSLPTSGGWESRHFRWVSLGHYLLRSGKNDIRLWADDHSYLPRIDKVRFVRTPPHRGKWLNEASKKWGLRKEILAQLQFVPQAWPPGIADLERFLVPESVSRIDTEIAKRRALHAPLPQMLAVTDVQGVGNEPIHIGGDTYNVEKKAVPRAVPSLARHLVKSPVIPEHSSGRLQLAQWIVDPGNPLTARVIANRLWQGHFGTGIVATSGDFGVQGANPTNQPLLDFLAARLIAMNWSLKDLHRLIVTSATYRQSSSTALTTNNPDPDNKLLWRYPRRRLEAEALYDSMLSLAGKVPRQPSGHPLDNSKSKDRAMYILTSGRSPMGMGTEIRKMLHLFGYDPSGVPVHKRDSSVNTSQSLFWLNNKLPRYYASKIAERLLALPDLNDEQRVTVAFRMILGHSPGPLLMEQTFTYLDHCRIVQDLGETASWARVVLGLFSSDNFSYLK